MLPDGRVEFIAVVSEIRHLWFFNNRMGSTYKPILSNGVLSISVKGIHMRFETSASDNELDRREFIRVALMSSALLMGSSRLVEGRTRSRFRIPMLF